MCHLGNDMFSIYIFCTGCDWEGREAAQHHYWHFGLGRCCFCDRALQDPVRWQEACGKLEVLPNFLFAALVILELRECPAHNIFASCRLLWNLQLRRRSPRPLRLTLLEAVATRRRKKTRRRRQQLHAGGPEGRHRLLRLIFEFDRSGTCFFFFGELASLYFECIIGAVICHLCCFPADDLFFFTWLDQDPSRAVEVSFCRWFVCCAWLLYSLWIGQRWLFSGRLNKTFQIFRTVQ